MKAKSWATLVDCYRLALAAYVARGSEEELQEGYELGRRALENGLGVLDLVRLHEEALAKPLFLPGGEGGAREAQAVALFLMEALGPFEVAHRGFRDTCERLRGLNTELELRNRELASTNDRLKREVRERKQAETALRESREHYIKLFNEARAMEENLRQLSNKVFTAQEEERKRVSQELHDEIGQVLTAANVAVALLRKLASDDTLRRKADEAQQLIENSMDMINRFARELRPTMLDHLGPYAAIQNYVKTFMERTGIKIDLEGTVEFDRLDGQQGTVLYRVAQESLTNVYKHAQATHVTIRLRQLPRAVLMEISDNGRSFAATNGDPRQRLGLLGMQERVRLVNGEFAVESAPRRGTTVRVQIPFSPRPLTESRAETLASN